MPEVDQVNPSRPAWPVRPAQRPGPRKRSPRRREPPANHKPGENPDDERQDSLHIDEYA
ncbi:MAG: hypothetical protein QNJ87_14535 [Gammaproteobacteria bacterium]|nr:hypothetical protein [Gammaproteobacteria bacterium]MDJ0872968.1 hypothetical protein [Gammaproteobacteria bacterium]MDJ0890331.1 hypothetical protein [Gammaproteobacteria bacterium]